MHGQRLTLRLEGITAGDYLAWVRDPEPAALGRGLCAVEIVADPLGNTIDARLCWDASAPPPEIAAPAAGLPLVEEVVSVAAVAGAARLPCAA